MTMPGTLARESEQAPATGGHGLTWLACGVALLATAGSVYLTLGMNLKACPLCLYQRTCVMAVLTVLLVGLLAGNSRPGLLSLLALPAAVGGLVVAGFHTYLEWNGTLECPQGVLGIGSAPQQALASILVLVVLLGLDACCCKGPPGPAVLALAAVLALGGLFGFGLIRTAPPLPQVPKDGWPEKDVNKDGCRPVDTRTRAANEKPETPASTSSRQRFGLPGSHNYAFVRSPAEQPTYSGRLRYSRSSGGSSASSPTLRSS